MAYKISVLYPNHADSVFDMDYYRSTHLPLVERHWKSQGLLDWELIEYTTVMGDEKFPFARGVTMTWKDEQAFLKATSPDLEASKEIANDVAKFSNYAPTRVLGHQIARG